MLLYNSCKKIIYIYFLYVIVEINLILPEIYKHVEMFVLDILTMNLFLLLQQFMYNY